MAERDETSPAETEASGLPAGDPTVPVGRLDADQFDADDLDGVTESVFGAGNMGFASLQALQTDAAIVAQEPAGGLADPQVQAGGGPMAPSGGAEVASLPGEVTERESVDTDRPAGADAPATADSSSGSETSFTNATVGSVGASQLSSDAGSFAPAGSGLGLLDGFGDAGADATEATSTREVVNGDGDDGDRGDPGGDSGTGDVYNIQNILNLDIDLDFAKSIEINQVSLIDLGDSLTSLNQVITQTTTSLIDIVNQVAGDLTEIAVDVLVEDLTVVIETLTDTVTEALGDVLTALGDGGGVTELAVSLVANSVATLQATLETLNQTVTVVKTLVGNLGDGLLGGLVEQLELTVDTVLTSVTSVLDFTLVTVTEIGEGALDPAVSLVDGALDGVTGLLGDGADGLLSDVTGAIDGLLGGSEGGDTDLAIDTGIEVLDTVLDVPVLDVALDPVEDLIGDVDAVLSLGLDLLDDSDTDNAAGDEDIVIESGVELLDDALADVAAAIELDAIEALAGDIDIDLTAGLDLLGDAAGPLVDDAEGGSGDGLLADAGDALGGLLGGLLGGDGTGDTDIALETGVGILDETVIDIGGDLALDPVEDLAGDLDIDADLALDLLGGADTDGQAGDTDITLQTDIDLVDGELADLAESIELDPLESLVGDVDLDLAAGADLLGDAADGVVDDAGGGTGDETLLLQVGDALGASVESLAASGGGDDTDAALDADIELLDQPVTDLALDAVIDPVEDLAGDLDIATDVGVDLLNAEGTDNAGGDTDIAVETDIDLVDENLAQLAEAIELDPLEELVGDVDLELSTGIDLLGDAADGVVDEADGGTGEETLLSETGDLLGDAVSGLLNIESDIALLDPGSDAGEGGDSIWTDTTLSDTDDALSGIADDGGDLPDPSGTVAEGLGFLSVDSDGGSSLGGLFG